MIFFFLSLSFFFFTPLLLSTSVTIYVFCTLIFVSAIFHILSFYFRHSFGVRVCVCVCVCVCVYVCVYVCEKVGGWVSSRPN